MVQVQQGSLLTGMQRWLGKHSLQEALRWVSLQSMLLGRGQGQLSPVCCNFCSYLRSWEVFCARQQVCDRSILKDCSQRGKIQHCALGVCVSMDSGDPHTFQLMTWNNWPTT